MGYFKFSDFMIKIPVGISQVLSFRGQGRGLLLAVSTLEAVFCTFSLPRDSFFPSSITMVKVSVGIR